MPMHYQACPILIPLPGVSIDDTPLYRPEGEVMMISNGAQCLARSSEMITHDGQRLKMLPNRKVTEISIVVKIAYELLL
uniref:Uncharacterized protein n=1 Tax=Romanomermis culicivorax TaxID=13658 RepID=A0A915JTG2_ROMCU